MLKLFLTATLIILLILAILTGCSEPAPTQDPTNSPGPAIAPSLTPGDMPAETPLPVSTATPERNAANTPLPANTPAPEGTEAPLRATSEPETLPPGGVITPLNLGDSEAALSRLSKPEISCLITGRWPRQAARDTQGCQGASPGGRGLDSGLPGRRGTLWRIRGHVDRGPRTSQPGHFHVPPNRAQNGWTSES